MGGYNTIGHQFEEFVSLALQRIGLSAVRTEARSREDTIDKVDLILTAPDGLRFEIQLTLRKGDGYKISNFARVALATVNRGIRIYVEAHVQQRGLHAMARETAHAIRALLRPGESFGEHDLLGIRVKPNGSFHRFNPWQSIERKERERLLQERARVLFSRWIDSILDVEELPVPEPVSVPVAAAAAPNEIPPARPPRSPMLWTILTHATTHMPWVPRARIHPKHRTPRVAHRPYHRLAA